VNLYPYSQEQQLLFPPHIKDKLSDDHLAVIINDVVENLDLSFFTKRFLWKAAHPIIPK
jgi:hypothetical protein